MSARFVYFARCVEQPGPIKIGCSSAPSIRVHQLGFDLATPVEVLARAPGDFALERNLHRKFRDLRTAPPVREGRPNIAGRTEWFEPASTLLDFIAEVLRTGAIRLPRSERLEVAFLTRRRAGMTLQAIGSEFGVTRERVRQVLEEQKRKARAA